VSVTIIAGNTLLEFDVGELSDQLGEYSSAGIHPPLFSKRAKPFFSPVPPVFSSNRFSAECHPTV
jgi:hypothetical protein